MKIQHKKPPRKSIGEDGGRRVKRNGSGSPKDRRRKNRRKGSTTNEKQAPSITHPRIKK